MRADKSGGAVAAICLAVLALSACGGSSKHSSTVASQPATTTGQAAQQTVTATATTTTTTTTGSGATAAARPAGPPVCLTAHLSLALAGSQGAAGTAYITYELTNTGSSSCSMIGYPGVSVLSARGAIVQHPATRGANPPVPVRRVVLAPGHKAKFLVNSTDVVPSPGCPTSYTGVTLQVFPPNQRAALRIAYKGTFCNLRVGPVQPA